MNRRNFLTRAGAASAAALLAPALGRAGDRPGPVPVRFPNPDVVVLDPRFARYKLGHTPIQRLATGCLWAEGPAWNAVGRYLLWSDIPNNRQLRWLDGDGHVGPLRQPVGHSNGNTFDWQGRQVSCEHEFRRVVRYEWNGTVTVLADRFQGRPFNAPNDVVVHPDGGIWFTDPGYGSMNNYEGNKGLLELKEAVYRIDPVSGRAELVTDECAKPNGLCFSSDYRRLYVSDTGGKPPHGIRVWDLTDSGKLRNGRPFASMKYRQWAEGLADGMRTDTDGNLWASAGWAGEGYDGVHVFSPEGERIGQVLLPETCSNVCFGGLKRNRLFMTASQSLYAVYVDAVGSHVT